MQTLELFAGCGGLVKGLELAGFEHAGLLEINHQACESLRANFNPRLVHETDVKKVDFRAFASVDIVSGGPPCQPFSLGGLAKAHNDTRDMFPQAIRAISEIKPKGFVFENVKGLLRTKFAPYFKYIIQRLTYPDCVQVPKESWEEHAARIDSVVAGGRYNGLKYRVQYKLLNAADYGVPQVRERVFIVGLREDVKTRWTWPEKICRDSKDRVSIAAALKDIGNPRSKNNPFPDHVFIDGARIYPGHTGSDVNKPSKTIKAGAHGVPGGENMLCFPDGSLRYMTIHEAKLIQTFPSDFVITGSWGEALRQIGNAVPVKIAEAVGHHLYNLLKNDPIFKCHVSTQTKVQYHGALPGEQMMLAMEEPAVYVVKKRPLTLFATYPRANRNWILNRGFYNYPVASKDEAFCVRAQMARRLVLQNRRSKPICFDVIECQTATKQKLMSLNYPRTPHHARYILFTIRPADRPITQVKESDFEPLVGKGRTYEQFLRYFGMQNT